MTDNIIVKNILFRVDTGTFIGLGHLSRCRSLMLGFIENTHCKFTILTNNIEQVEVFLKNIKVDIYELNTAFSDKLFDIAIVDILKIPMQEQFDIVKMSKIIVSIDDDGNGLFYQDILICPNLQKKTIPTTIQNFLHGNDYIILHPDFQKYCQINKNNSQKVKRVFICFGGSDPARLTKRITSILNKTDFCFNIHIVIGSAITWFDEILVQIDNDKRFLINKNLSNIAESMWQADIAIISGGTLLYESCSLGIPSVVICQNNDQNAEAILFKESIINLGVHDTISDTEIMHAIKKLSVNPSLRRKMSVSAKKLIPADGTSRIVQKILNFKRK